MLENNKFIRYFKAKKDRKSEKVLLLLLHGNSEDFLNTYEAETGFLELGYDICSYSFRKDCENSNVVSINNTFLELVEEFEPNYIFLQLQKTNLISIDILKYIKKNYPSIIITNYTGDVHWDQNPIPQMVKYSPFVDASFICSKEEELYKIHKCENVFYIPTSYEFNKFYPFEEEERIKLKLNNKFSIVFTGNNYGSYIDSPLRVEMVKYLNDKFGNKFQVFGINWILNNQQQPILSFDEQLKLYNSVDIGVVLDNRIGLDGYWSDRRLIIMACKCLVLAKYTPNCENYFKDGEEIVYWNTFQELEEKIKFYLNNKGECQKIVNNAYNLVYNNYRWDIVLERFYFPKIREIKNGNK